MTSDGKPEKRSKNERPKGRVPRSAFKKGNQAAKGHGRPRISPEYKKAMKQLDPMAGQVFGEIMKDEAHKDRFRAAEYVWNRNHGMPRTHVQLSTPPGAPVEVKVKPGDPTSDDLRRELASLVGGAAAGKSPDAPASDEE